MKLLSLVALFLVLGGLTGCSVKTDKSLGPQNRITDTPPGGQGNADGSAVKGDDDDDTVVGDDDDDNRVAGGDDDDDTVVGDDDDDTVVGDDDDDTVVGDDDDDASPLTRDEAYVAGNGPSGQSVDAIHVKACWRCHKAPGGSAGYGIKSGDPAFNLAEIKDWGIQGPSGTNLRSYFNNHYGCCGSITSAELNHVKAWVDMSN